MLLGDTTAALNASLLTAGPFTFGNPITIQSGNTGVMTIGGNTAAASSFTGAINLGTASGTQKNVALVALAGGSVDFTGVIDESTSVPSSNVTIGDSTHSGTVKLSNVANAYGGITTIGSGATLEATKVTASGSNSSIGNSALAATNLVIDNGTLQYTARATAQTACSRSARAAPPLTLLPLPTRRYDLHEFWQSGHIERRATHIDPYGASTGANSFASVIVDQAAVTGLTNLVKSGAGTWTLSGENSYTGVTTLAAGMLSVATIGNGGVSGNLGAATNAAANLVFDGGTLQYTGATASTDRNFTINAGKTATVDVTVAANTLTISGAAAATNGALTKIGDGTLALSGTNLYTGATTIAAGILNANAMMP